MLPKDGAWYVAPATGRGYYVSSEWAGQVRLGEWAGVATTASQSATTPASGRLVWWQRHSPRSRVAAFAHG